MVQLVITLLFCLIGKQGLDRADGEKVRKYFFSFESEDKTGIQLCWLQGYYLIAKLPLEVNSIFLILTFDFSA